jgi:hypothetical protein
MNNDELISILRKLLDLGLDIDLDFLNGIHEADLKTLIACIRDRIEKVGSRRENL